MSEVTLHINGREYRVRARDGEEEQLVRASHRVDAKCEAVKAGMGAVSDASLFFYAALMLADEMAGGAEGIAASNSVSALADRLEALAGRIEA